MDYKEEMIHMISKMTNEKMLKILYNFVCSFYKEERAGR